MAFRRWIIFLLPLQNIWPIHACGCGFNQHFARLYLWYRHVVIVKTFCPPAPFIDITFINVERFTYVHFLRLSMARGMHCDGD